MDEKGDHRTMTWGRREFVKVGGLGAAAAAAAIGTTACGPDAATTRGSTADAPWWTTETFELEEATFADLLADMASGRRSAVEITQLYLDRIAAVDGEGPKLRAIIETNPDALDIARQLDEEGAGGSLRGPLHGIPIVVKDNIDTADRMTTTAGSYALEGHVAAQDSHVAAQLRKAGAIILAKSNLSEWGELPLHAVDVGMEWSRRPVRERVCGRSKPVRLVRGVGCGHLGQPVRRLNRYRDQRLDRVPILPQRRRRPEAHGRSRRPLGYHPHLAHAGHRGPDGAYGGGRGSDADPAGGARPT